VLEIVQLPVLRDNYTYLLRCPDTDTVGLVDAPTPEPVLAELAARGWTLDWILNTHHHWDHIGANLALKEQTGCRIVGPDDRIPGLDVPVGQDDVFRLGDQAARVHFVPGHTHGHIAYHFADSRALFCGDTIFVAGCGRLFEGTPAQMWDSLRRLRELPDDTLVYCAHEYTQSNIRFARTVDPDNQALIALSAQVDAKRAKGERTVPSTIGQEKATNPFLRADHPALAAAVGLTDPAEVLGAVRARKDTF
jgi:hydroxyacylglutathione hydrolase